MDYKKVGVLIICILLTLFIVKALQPNQPILNYPLNGSENISRSPILNLTVSDPEGGSLDVSFYQDFGYDKLKLENDYEWTMFRNSLNHSGETNSYAPLDLDTIDSYSALGSIQSSPAIANGYVYFGSDDHKVYQLNATDMSFVNSYETGSWVFSSPAIANGYVYIGSYDHKVYQLNATDMSLVNNYTTGGNIESSPAIANGYVYIGSDDFKIYQFHASNLSLVNNYTTEGYIRSSPAVANGYVYIGGQDNIYQLNATDLSLINNYDIGMVGYNIFSSPAVANGYVYIGGAGTGLIYQLNATDMSLVNNYSVGSLGKGVDSSPAVTSEYLYIGTETYGSSLGGLYQLNATDLSFIDHYEIDQDIISSPAIANGYVYFGGGANDLFYKVGKGDGLLNSQSSISNDSEVTYQWNNLSRNTNYEWFSRISSGGDVIYSDTWNFRTLYNSFKLNLLSPENSLNIYKNNGFWVELNITCLETNCDDISVSLDPIISGLGNNYTISEYNGNFNSSGCISNHQTGNDDGSYTINSLGFDFPWFNTTKTSGTPIYMDTNGRLSWSDSSSDYGGSDSEMQNEENIAANWQDLGGGPLNNEYYCVNQGESPNRYAVFLWDSQWYDGAGSAQLEVVLHEDGDIEINYGEIGDSSETSYRGISLGNGVDYNYNTTSSGGSDPGPLSVLTSTSDSNTGWLYNLDSGKGLVNTTTGATPFYTNKSSNPYTINLAKDESEIVKFWVNATGINETYDFFAYAEDINSLYSGIDLQSDHWNVTILENNKPLINFVNTTSNGTLNQDYIQANVSANDTNLDTLSINLYNSEGIYQSNSTNESNLYVLFSDLSKGTYYLNATVNDSAGDTNSTSTRIIILDYEDDSSDSTDTSNPSERSSEEIAPPRYSDNNEEDSEEDSEDKEEINNKDNVDEEQSINNENEERYLGFEKVFNALGLSDLTKNQKIVIVTIPSFIISILIILVIVYLFLPRLRD